MEGRIQAFDYLQLHDPEFAIETARELQNDSDPELAAAAAARLGALGDQAATERFDRLLASFVDGPAEKRESAAHLVGLSLRDGASAAVLSDLLEDAEPTVVRAAIQSAGQLTRDEDLPVLIRLLGSRRYSAASRTAVSAYGDRAVPELGIIMRADGAGIHLQRQAARALGIIGGYKASQVLLAYLRRQRQTARTEALRSLSRIRDREPEVEFHRDVVSLLSHAALKRYFEATAEAESIEGSAPGPASRFLEQAVQERRDRTLNEVFELLSLLYPPREIRDARYRIFSGQPEQRANALEYLDSLLIGDGLRPLLLEALEQDQQGVMRSGARLFGFAAAPYPSVLRALLNSSDSWLQACACGAAVESNCTECKPRIEQLTQHPNPVLREAAVAAAASL